MVQLPPGGLIEAKDEEARAALIEHGRLLFTKPCNFFFAAQKLEQLPAAELPEVAFCGRSNVGKSSLVNALCNQKALARVSNTPGRTKQLNFFDLGARLVLVDMPGYGYAQAAKEVKEDWQGLMFNYLRGRPTLRRVFLLMDARIETKPADIMAMRLLNDAAVSFQLVLTKSDDTKPAWLEQRFEAVSKLARRHTAGHPLVLTTSSEKKSGLEEVRAEIAILANPLPADEPTA